MLLWPVFNIISCSSVPLSNSRVAAVALREWFEKKPPKPAFFQICDNSRQCDTNCIQLLACSLACQTVAQVWQFFLTNSLICTDSCALMTSFQHYHLFIRAFIKQPSSCHCSQKMIWKKSPKPAFLQICDTTVDKVFTPTAVGCWLECDTVTQVWQLFLTNFYIHTNSCALMTGFQHYRLFVCAFISNSRVTIVALKEWFEKSHQSRLSCGFVTTVDKAFTPTAVGCWLACDTVAQVWQLFLTNFYIRTNSCALMTGFQHYRLFIRAFISNSRVTTVALKEWFEKSHQSRLSCGFVTTVDNATPTASAVGLHATMSLKCDSFSSLTFIRTNNCALMTGFQHYQLFIRACVSNSWLFCRFLTQQ